MNYYDPSAEKWKQNWVDASGGIVWYEGQVKEGTIHFSGENILADGTKEIAQVTLKPLPNGNVHHLIKHSKDSGKTWYVYFDGMYVPMKEETTAKGSQP